MSFSRFPLCTLGLASLIVSSSLFAATISGKVTNRTNNRPAASDDVVLIRLVQGMQEAARTKTDPQGHYTLDVPEDGLHLIRVTHDKANYFRPVQPGTSTVDVDVFSAAAAVKGIAAEADVLRIQTDPGSGTLKIVENFFLRNDSAPPMTQFSERPFEFSLPAGAVVEGSAALAPGGMPVQASPVPLQEPNHYTFIFPIRPGETRFQIAYHLPYNGSVTLTPKPSLATDTIAVMMPKSMQFHAAADTPYAAVTDEVNAQTFVARHVQPSQALAFTVSGSGQLPRETQTSGSGSSAAENTQGESASEGTTPDQTKFGGGLGNPVDPTATNDPWAKYRWWILGGLGLLLAAGAGIMLQRPAPTANESSDGDLRRSAHGPEPQTSRGILAALKEEMFQLESDRVRGHIETSEYQTIKSALEVLLRRVIARDSPTAQAEAPSPELARSGPR